MDCLNVTLLVIGGCYILWCLILCASPYWCSRFASRNLRSRTNDRRHVTEDKMQIAVEAEAASDTASAPSRSTVHVPQACSDMPCPPSCPGTPPLKKCDEKCCWKRMAAACFSCSLLDEFDQRSKSSVSTLHNLRNRLTRLADRMNSCDDSLLILADARNMISGLVFRIQMIITIFIAFCLAFSWVCFYAVEELAPVISRSSLDVNLSDSGHKVLQESTLSLLSPAMWVIIALVCIVVIVIFIQKVVKFLVVQCDIMLMWSRLCSNIVFSDTLSREQVMEEFNELSEQILRKTQSGFLSNLFAGTSI